MIQEKTAQIVFFLVKIHKTWKDDFIQDEKSLMWMSAVQDYVKGEPSVTYLQVSRRFVKSLKVFATE